jgi:hypothetical protein
MAALVRGDDEQILFMPRESYGSHAAWQIHCRELGLTLTLECKDVLRRLHRLRSRYVAVHERVSLGRLKRSQYYPRVCQ